MDSNLQRLRASVFKTDSFPIRIISTFKPSVDSRKMVKLTD